MAPDTPLEHLHSLHQRGVRGVRLNTLATNGPSLDQLPRFEQLIQPQGWHLQLLLREDALPAALERLETIGCPVVLDHFASCSPRTAAATLDALFELAARQTNLWIKLSAPYLLSDCSPAALEHYRAFTEHGLAVMPERLLWATDWPHPALRERHPDTTRRLHERLCDWVTDARQRQRIEVSNPARLYGF
ncbi:hypothetical protein DNK34_22460 [Pseudomonas dryadis]|uniref:Amidohydrolase-related domain-containing protein n=1 Tax=Phytopseudomonas dryadis TaxID=2487520 RepID=A0A4Q9R8D6_9GAMM|nr:hypothetical protein DNK44_04175 [Pseudomonas dryadis]TBV00885.1 hypothetical protein DNK34_22460 [Pseudomonas dryadis]TBV13570.1 hypothetical protein DNK41_22130 [Pseudomonas sp. FRB 230]